MPAPCRRAESVVHLTCSCRHSRRAPTRPCPAAATMNSLSPPHCSCEEHSHRRRDSWLTPLTLTPPPLHSRHRTPDRTSAETRMMHPPPSTSTSTPPRPLTTLAAMHRPPRRRRSIIATTCSRRPTHRRTCAMPVRASPIAPSPTAAAAVDSSVALPPSLARDSRRRSPCTRLR